MSADGRWVALAAMQPRPGGPSECRVRDLTTGAEVVLPFPADGAADALAFDAAGRLHALFGEEHPDRTVFRRRAWDARTGREVDLPPAPTYTVGTHREGMGIALSPDGRTAAVAVPKQEVGEVEVEGRIEVWDLDTGRQRFVLKQDPGADAPLAFSPDGQRLVGTAGSGYRVGVWDAATGREVLPPVGGQWPIGVVAVSADGARVAAGGSSRVARPGWVRAWEVDGGREVVALTELPHPPHALAVHPSAPRVAVETDADLRVWDTATRAPVLAVAHRPAIRVRPTVAFTPDGHRLVRVQPEEWRQGSEVTVLDATPLPAPTKP